MSTNRFERDGEPGTHPICLDVEKYCQQNFSLRPGSEEQSRLAIPPISSKEETTEAA